MGDVETPSLYEISEMSRDAGLVGERDTHLVVFISCIHGGFVWMRSPSRSGKDQVVDAVEHCLPDSNGFGVFKVPTSSSPTALYKQAAEMNNKKIHRYPDIASLPEHLESVLKSHGEGKPISHNFATGTDAGEVESQTIHPPDAFILFHASDNEKVDPDDFPELRNRALMVSVDASEDLTKMVNERQAREEAGLYETHVEDERAQEVRDYIKKIPKGMYFNGPGEIQNPVAPAINNQNPLPQKFVEARQDFPRLLKFMSSVTLFHFRERLQLTNDGTPILLVTPADAWIAMRVFGQDMVLSALNLRDRDLDILRFLRDDMQSGMSKAEVHMELRETGKNVSERDVSTSLKGMLNKGYVKKDQSTNPVMWSATPFASQVSANVKLDWAEVIEDTKDTVREALDPEDAEEYIERFCEGNGVMVRSPFTGDVVDITEENELEEVIEERLKTEEKVMESTGFGEEEREEEDETEQEGQQALGGEIGA